MITSNIYVLIYRKIITNIKNVTIGLSSDIDRNNKFKYSKNLLGSNKTFLASPVYLDRYAIYKV